MTQPENEQGPQDQIQEPEVYIALARPWFAQIRETYVIGVYRNADDAFEAAENEAEYRGGKYEGEVLRAPIYATNEGLIAEERQDIDLKTRTTERHTTEGILRQLSEHYRAMHDRALRALHKSEARERAMSEAMSALLSAQSPEALEEARNAAKAALEQSAAHVLPTDWTQGLELNKGAHRYTVGNPQLVETASAQEQENDPEIKWAVNVKAHPGHAGVLIDLNQLRQDQRHRLDLPAELIDEAQKAEERRKRAQQKLPDPS